MIVAPKFAIAGVDSALSQPALGIRVSFLAHDAGSIILGAAETWCVAVALEARD